MSVKNWLNKKTSRRSILKGAAAGGLGAIAAKIAGEAEAHVVASPPEVQDVELPPIPQSHTSTTTGSRLYGIASASWPWSPMTSYTAFYRSSPKIDDP